jgi:hypothetical protein
MAYSVVYKGLSRSPGAIEKEDLAQLVYSGLDDLLKSFSLLSVHYCYPFCSGRKFPWSVIVKLLCNEMVAGASIPVFLWCRHRREVVKEGLPRLLEGYIDQVQPIVIDLIVGRLCHAKSSQSRLKVIANVHPKLSPELFRFGWIAKQKHGSKKVPKPSAAVHE